MAEDLTDFLHALGASPEFQPLPYYVSSGDCIVYHWRSDEYYRDRIDDKLTVYRAIDSDEAVGCQIKGVDALKRKFGDFGVALNETDGTPLAMFLFVSQIVADSPAGSLEDRINVYKYLLEQVGRAKVEVESETTAD